MGTMESVDFLKPIDTEELKKAVEEARSYVDNVYLHWSAGHYGQVWSSYHLSIDKDGRMYAPSDYLNFRISRNHTWKRNSRSVGICVMGCYDAEANSGFNLSMGSEPVTPAQIEAMALVMAYFNKYAYVPMENMLTHCEAALQDDYGPFSGDEDTRWDLWYVPDSAYNGQLRPGGVVLRGKAEWYANSLS